jgi:hypothetical protein
MSSMNLAKSTLTRLTLIAIVILLGSGISVGQDRRNFWLLNNTGQVISNFHVSPHESNHWGKDVLGTGDLPNGIGAVISFASGVRTSCVMDFKLVFDDGTEQTYRQGRNVCSLGAVQFNRRDSVGLLFPE